VGEEDEDVHRAAQRALRDGGWSVLVGAAQAGKMNFSEKKLTFGVDFLRIYAIF
jgi:hypothetical protein